MPNITKVDLSRYRFQKAEEMLASAKRDMEARDYASANNRAYYAIFHAMRAVLALDGEDLYFTAHCSTLIVSEILFGERRRPVRTGQDATTTVAEFTRIFISALSQIPMRYFPVR